VAGGGVHAAGAAVGRHIIREDDGRGAVDERVARREVFERAAGAFLGDRGLAFKLDGREERAEERLGADDALGAEVNDHVLEVRVDGDGEVGRDRPRRGGPDDDGERFVGRQVELGCLLRRHGELHPDGGGDVVLVLDLGFREGGFEGDGPVNGLLAAVNEALFDEGREGAHDVGFEAGRLGFVLVGPVGLHAEAAELGALFRDPLLGKLVATFAQLGGRDRHLLLLERAGDLLLDGQAVAVPAGDVRRAETAHRFVAKRDVLESLVERGADVDVAVGERRAVVQDEGGCGGAFLLNGVVEPQFVPVGDSSRLTLNEIGPHGKIGFG